MAVDFLDCGDGALRRGVAEEDALIEVLRRWRPEILSRTDPRRPPSRPWPGPSAGRRRRFYAGLTRRGAGSPHRPAAVFSYMQHDPFAPSFIVDVSAVWEKKLAALAAYGSQLYQPGSDRDEPPTKVSSPEYSRAVVGRAQHFGLLIGAAYGEPFLSRLPLAVHDVMSLVPSGLR